MQMSGMTKEIRSFLFHSRVQLNLLKVNANERNNKTKYAVFDFVIPECSLTYLKLMQMSGMTKEIRSFLHSLTKSTYIH